LKNLIAEKFDPALLLSETKELLAFLASKTEFSERDDIAPFFYARKQLMPACAWLCGICPTRYASELDLWDYRADVAAGDSDTSQYVLVELEDAKPNSLFAPGKKFKIDYGYRAAHGITQIADWFEQINRRQNTKVLEERFDKWAIEFRGLVLVGIDRHIDVADLKMCKERLSSLSASLSIFGKPVQILTYDDFCAMLLKRLAVEHDLT
jgi:hypothetical protein